jgi:serine/threonine-protein kinase RsbT
VVHSMDIRPADDLMDQKIVMIAEEPDISNARQLGRDLALRAGFPSGDQTVIDAVISEIARNILSFAGRGQITLSAENDGAEPSIVVVARDQGPGIADVARALQEGFSTSGGNGLGLAGARRLMDAFELVSVPGEGTTVTMKKWRRRHD